FEQRRALHTGFPAMRFTYRAGGPSIQIVPHSDRKLVSFRPALNQKQLRPILNTPQSPTWQLRIQAPAPGAVYSPKVTSSAASPGFVSRRPSRIPTKTNNAGSCTECATLYK